MSALDLSAGSVLHIEQFVTEGFDPADKFVFLIGMRDTNTVLAFVITSQDWNIAMHAKELVVLPKGSVNFLPEESYIQCHCLHALDVNDLEGQFSAGRIRHRGNLGTEVLQLVLDVVADSELLSVREIQEVFTVLSHLN